MSEVEFKQQRFTREPYESVLDCLLRHGQALPYACKAGMCQACLVRAESGNATAESQKWIKPELRARGYTLACQWVPDGDVAAALPGIEEFSLPVRIVSLQTLSTQILRLRLEPEEPRRMFAYQPGQYLSLINPAGVTRSYSIANDYRRDGYLELHISRTLHGLFTGWLFAQAAPGQRLYMRGPAGTACYRTPEHDAAPLLLAGTGAGLAPLYALLHAALADGHRGPIHLCHGGRRPEHLYYTAELQQLAAQHANFHYHRCIIDAPAGGDYCRGRLEHGVDTVLDALAQDSHPARMLAWLSGAPNYVYSQRKRLYLRGLRAANIHCDPFTERHIAHNIASPSPEPTPLT